MRRPGLTMETCPVPYHRYECSLCSYSRRMLVCRNGTTEYADRDEGRLNGYAGATFSFATRAELEAGIRDLFSPGKVTFDDYGDFLAVEVLCNAGNTSEVTDELLDAFRAGKCCLWEYTLTLSSDDGTLCGFLEDEGIRDIPQDQAALDKVAGPALARVAEAWRILRERRGSFCAEFPVDIRTLAVTMAAMDWTHRNVPRLHEIVAALEPYTVETYPGLAEAYASLFGCSLERAREREEYFRRMAGGSCYMMADEVEWREDVCYADFGSDGRVCLVRAV